MEENNLFVLMNEDKSHQSESILGDKYSYWNNVFKQFFKKKIVVVAVSILLLLTIFSFVYPVISNATINVDLLNKHVEPQFFSGDHFFGTDQDGRDIGLIICEGFKISLFIALSATLINTFVGIVVGSIWGYFKKIDFIMNELYNLIMNIPAMLKYFVIIAILKGIGFSSLTSIIVGMTATGWFGLARAVRNRIIIFSNREFNVASRTLGSSSKSIIIYNLLPQMLTIIITTTALAIPAYVAAEASLAYFGIGFSPTDISLGMALKQGYSQLSNYAYILTYPAIMLGLFTLSLYLIGQSLADSVDPKNHR